MNIAYLHEDEICGFFSIYEVTSQGVSELHPHKQYLVTNNC